MPTMTFSRSWRFRIERQPGDNWPATLSQHTQGLFQPELLTVHIGPTLERPETATFIIRGPGLNGKGQPLGHYLSLSSRAEEIHAPAWAQPYIDSCIARAQLDYDYMRNGAALSESWSQNTAATGDGEHDH